MGSRSLIGHAELVRLVDELPPRCERGGRLYLLGDTSHLLERWHPAVTSLSLATDGDAVGEAVATAAAAAAARHGIPVAFESPADVVPLPDGSATRHRPTGYAWDVPGGRLEVLHYDPYAVICRGIVRGDEPDYQTALRYLRHGWVTLEHMTELYQALLPSFSTETIAQDPAEFRRKFKGLTQMWRAAASAAS